MSIQPIIIKKLVQTFVSQEAGTAKWRYRDAWPIARIRNRRMSTCVYPCFHKRPLFLIETQNVDIFTTKGITES